MVDYGKQRTVDIAVGGINLGMQVWHESNAARLRGRLLVALARGEVVEVMPINVKRDGSASVVVKVMTSSDRNLWHRLLRQLGIR